MTAGRDLSWLCCVNTRRLNLNGAYSRAPRPAAAAAAAERVPRVHHL